MFLTASRLRLAGLAFSLLLGGAPVAAADGFADNSPSEPTAESHRRRAADEVAPEKNRSSRRSPQADDVTQSPLDRLRQRGDDPNVMIPAYGGWRRPTLAEVMRRVAGLGDSCPLCGTPHQERQGERAGISNHENSTAIARRTFREMGVEETAAERPGGEQLRSGEPAQVILDTQKRLGKSVLEGTEFGGSPELLIQWIRVLDEENRRRHAEELPRPEAEAIADEGTAVTGNSQVDALRKASRQLQEAADLLEEQNLFDSADSIRAAADGLRQESRQMFSELQGGDITAPLSPAG